jgi:hypothetical protein
VYAVCEAQISDCRQQLREPTRQEMITLTRARGPIFRRNQVIGALTPSLIEKWRAAGDYPPLVRLFDLERPPAVIGPPPIPISVVQFVCVLVQVADRKNYLAGDHIYSVKTKDMVSYSLDPGETPVLPGCRSGQIFHSEVYGSDPGTLTKALRQIQRHSKSVVVGIARLGEARIREFEYPSS